MEFVALAAEARTTSNLYSYFGPSGQFFSSREILKIMKLSYSAAISDSQNMERLMAWEQKVQQYIPVDQWAVVVEYDWNPTYVFPLERKTIVVTPREINKPLCQLLTDKRFSLVVVGNLYLQ